MNCLNVHNNLETKSKHSLSFFLLQLLLSQLYFRERGLNKNFKLEDRNESNVLAGLQKVSFKNLKMRKMA